MTMILKLNLTNFSQRLKIGLICICIILLTQYSFALDIERFKLPLPVKAPKSLFTHPQPPKISFSFEPSIEDHNRSVSLNNAGIEALESGNFQKAIELFSESTKINPKEKGLWKNLLNALKKAGKYDNETIKVANTLFAISPDDFIAPYAIGFILSNYQDKPQEAIPYFELARTLKPDDPNLHIALALALKKSGYSKDALEILEKYAFQVEDNVYPVYVMAGIYFDSLKFDKSIKVLEKILHKDQEGFVHDLYIRSMFYAGNLEGLEEKCYAALNKFPQIINRQTIEKILYSLTPKSILFSEILYVTISNPDALKTMKFVSKLIPNIPSKQKVEFINAIISSEKGTVIADHIEKDGKIIFNCPSELFTTKLSVRLDYKIDVLPFFRTSASLWGNEWQDPAAIKSDKIFSFTNNDFLTLVQYFSSQKGDFLKNAFIGVGQGLKYQENYKVHSIDWILENPDSCDCTEYSVLLAALCLEKGIPAKVTTGFLLEPEEDGQETQTGHAWCQVFVEGKGWISVDPTLGASTKFAYFGNCLADQILFEEPLSEKVQLNSIITTSTGDQKINLETRYVFNLQK